MGFFDTILSFFGVGQPKLSISTSRAQCGRGAVIDCTLTLTGGNRPLPIAAFKLSVNQEKKVANAEGGSTTTWNDVHKLVVPMGGRVIHPNETLTFKARVQVPADAEPTGGDIAYAVKGVADVPGLDADAKAPLTVTAEADPMAAEDLSRYHVLDQPRTFRRSSVKGISASTASPTASW